MNTTSAAEQQKAQLNFRTLGQTPRIGDILNSRHVYLLTDRDGWEVKVDANDMTSAIEYAAGYGFTASLAHQFAEAA
jgi:hypothetical protein